MDDRQSLANVITTSWAGIVPNNMVMLPMDSSTSSASIILVEEFHLNGRYYSNQAPASLPPPPTVLKYVHNPNTGRTSCAPAAWTLDRFTKTFFWNFQSIQADLCYILTVVARYVEESAVLGT